MNKKILIITQTVDERDSNLGFFCGWIREFSKQCTEVYVIANKVGEYNFSENVEVFSLGKEVKLNRIFRIFRFWKYLFRYLPKIDSVFVHMCPEYIIYGGWAARIYGKKIGLWYLHKSLTLQLRLSVLFVNCIFTAHEDGFPMKSSKLVITGHGIDLELFNGSNKVEDNIFTILTAGRISESKNLLILAKTAILLRDKIDKGIKFVVVGEAYLERDKKYLQHLKDYVKEQHAEDIVKFVGKVSHGKMVYYYKTSDIFLNASQTGGVDKAVLEAMASKLSVITSNSAFKNILPGGCLFEDGNEEDLLSKILNYKHIDKEGLYNIVATKHSLKNTISKILTRI